MYQFYEEQQLRRSVVLGAYVRSDISIIVFCTGAAVGQIKCRNERAQYTEILKLAVKQLVRWAIRNVTKDRKEIDETG